MESKRSDTTQMDKKRPPFVVLLEIEDIGVMRERDDANLIVWPDGGRHEHGRILRHTWRRLDDPYLHPGSTRRAYAHTQMSA